MRQIKLITAALFALGPLTANADLIAYEFTGTSASGWSLTGQVVIDETDLIPFANLVGVLDSWSFSWTDGVDTLSNSSADTTLYNGIESLFAVDNLLNVFDVWLCTGACEGGGSSWPEILVTDSNWDASITPQGNCCVQIGGPTSVEWSGAQAVPEPSTLILLGIGLAGIGLARRRRKV